jgi:hypothetical protein
MILPPKTRIRFGVILRHVGGEISYDKAVVVVAGKEVEEIG